MPKRGENIRRRKDGRWEGRYICCRDCNGKAKYHSVYAKSYAEVRQLLCNAKAGLVLQKQKDFTLLSFETVATQWLSGCSLHLKTSTIVKYTALLNNHILPSFKGINISLVSEKLIVKFIQEKSSYLSNSTIRSLLTIIKSVLKYAIKHGWCNNLIIDIRVPAKQRKNISALSMSERQKLEKFLLTDMDTIKLGIYLCLYTGLRIGELCALRWGDIDFSTTELRIVSTIQRIKQMNQNASNKTILVISSPKSTSSIRSIPLPLQLIDLLKRYSRSDECFILSGNTKPVEPRTMQYRFKKYANQLGLSYSNLHVLRHTFATQCIELGFDVKTLSELLGHSRVEITLNRYVHSSDTQKRVQMNLLFEQGQNCGQNAEIMY